MAGCKSIAHEAKEHPVDSDPGRQVGTPKRPTVKEEPRHGRVRADHIPNRPRKPLL